LYQEADIVPDLLIALKAIDYPIDKLEIFLIVESSDPKTYAAVLDSDLPDHMHVFVVPSSPPQTKPQALNHALAIAQGTCVVVYDAEDVPDPGQLRAAAAILESDPSVGCVQACLNVYNSDESFFTRQFTIEYTALFDCLLPTLRRLGFPVPLGGTSNHFRRSVLLELGGWDSFNVTEDADLGICLARAGYHVEILSLTTWEEAPANFSVWLRQRTRWLKGWMQTYLVHMRRPKRLLDELGGRGFVGLQVFMGGVLLSVLVHPWFYILAVMDLGSGDFFHPATTSTGLALWWIGIFNLVAGYCAGVALGSAAVWARGWRHLVISGLWMPVYWLLISCAAYRALWQLGRAPFHWEKTEHRPRAQKVATASPNAELGAG
ncbi:MAG: glycosyltransferase, partial [Alphaproteobacteria bacterium]|nr:glycosyltransferase [Alphaproteobacteria bacterium]